MSNYHITDRALLRRIFWFRLRRRAVRLAKRLLLASLVLLTGAGVLWVVIHGYPW